MKSAQRKTAMKKWLPWVIAILLINTGACVSLCFFEFRLLPIVLGVLSLMGSMAVVIRVSMP